MHRPRYGLRSTLRGLHRRQALWSILSGVFIAIGYLCYFLTRGTLPRAVAYAFGCSAGSTGMVWGLLYFKEYEGAPRHKKALLLLALLLYPSSIALVAASIG